MGRKMLSQLETGKRFSMVDWCSSRAWEWLSLVSGYSLQLLQIGRVCFGTTKEEKRRHEMIELSVGKPNHELNLHFF